VGLALGRAGRVGGEGGTLLQRGAVEFERGGEADRVALAAADRPAGGERLADGLVASPVLRTSLGRVKIGCLDWRGST
jgi:hypothetical protein